MEKAETTLGQVGLLNVARDKPSPKVQVIVDFDLGLIDEPAADDTSAAAQRLRFERSTLAQSRLTTPSWAVATTS